MYYVYPGVVQSVVQMGVLSEVFYLFPGFYFQSKPVYVRILIFVLFILSLRLRPSVNLCLVSSLLLLATCPKLRLQSICFLYSTVVPLF